MTQHESHVLLLVVITHGIFSNVIKGLPLMIIDDILQTDYLLIVCILYLYGVCRAQDTGIMRTMIVLHDWGVVPK